MDYVENNLLPIENSLHIMNKKYRYSSKVKRRAYRRSGNKRNKLTTLKILHSNIDGYISKNESVNEIIQQVNHDVFPLNETALKGRRKIDTSGYISFEKNRLNNKGGVATSIAEYLKKNTVKQG